jgi:hypothetical protein
MAKSATPSKQDAILKFDSRMTEYNLRQGGLTQAELDKHLSQLPDVGHMVLIDAPEAKPAATETH